MLDQRTTTAPMIRTELPGPIAQRMIHEDEKVTSPSYTRFYPLVAKCAEGAMVEDVDGNLFLDFAAGIAVCNTGHCHPRVVQAIQHQASQLIHFCGADFYYEPLTELATKLASLAPGDSEKLVYFGNSGAEAVEAAIKMARYHTQRQHLIAFHGAFHGRTMGALSITGSKVQQKRRFSPLIPGVSHIDYSMKGLDHLENVLFKRLVAPEEVAAIVVEPIQGEGGYIVPENGFHERIQEICRKHHILYVMDEIQAGMGRTGKMFAIEHWNVEPDIICVAKGLASGMPLGAVIAKKEVMDWAPGSHASTFGGNPVCCAAANETIALLEEDLISNAKRVGGKLFSLLENLSHECSLIHEVRGKGMMIGVELRHPTLSHSELLKNVLQSCFERGLILLSCGENAIRFCPPLVITEDQAIQAVGIFKEALGQVE